MPSNLQADPYKARQLIDKVLSEGVRDDKEIEYLLLVKQVLLAYPDSELMVENFISRFYVDTGEFRLENGVLRRHA